MVGYPEAALLFGFTPASPFCGGLLSVFEYHGWFPAGAWKEADSATTASTYFLHSTRPLPTIITADYTKAYAARCPPKSFPKLVNLNAIILFDKPR